MKTRLTERLGLAHPIIQAPMAFAAGGALAAASSRCGALGLIGGGYCDPEWINTQFAIAGQTRVGCGFITWKLMEQPALLDRVLERAPTAIFLSFGDPAALAPRIRQAGVPLICQVQTLRDARRAIEIGADILVAQGTEAGGHGEARGTMALVPEVADELGRAGSDALLCAAGGIADGRGLAAALMLGADGVVIGTRLWATPEALVSPRVQSHALRACGDDTMRTHVVDIVRGYDWPERYSLRARSNPFLKTWHHRTADLTAQLDRERARWDQATAADDPDIATALVGEGIGLIDTALPAARIIADISQTAAALIGTDDATHLGRGDTDKRWP